MSERRGRDNGRGQPGGDGGHLGDELLSRLADGDLATDERRLADAHLITCARCRESLDALRSTVALLRALPEPRPARSLQLSPAHARRPSGWRRFSAQLTTGMPALRAAVVAIVLIVGGAAAFGALRDGEPRRNPATNTQAEPTVAYTGGEAAPTSAATLQEPTLVEGEATTAPPTETVDTTSSRSGPPAEAAALPTSTSEPPGDADESAPVSAAPDAAPTNAPGPTATPARDSIFGIEEEPAAEDSAAGGADESSDSRPSDAPVAAPTSTTEVEAEESDADLAPAADDGLDAADEADAGSPSDDDPVRTGVAPDAAAEQDAEAASSATREEPTPSSPPSATASPTAIRHRTNTPATPVTSPVASPVASPIAFPVASPIASPSGTPVASVVEPDAIGAFAGDVEIQAMRLDLARALIVGSAVALGLGLAVVGRATLASSREPAAGPRR